MEATINSFFITEETTQYIKESVKVQVRRMFDDLKEEISVLSDGFLLVKWEESSETVYNDSVNEVLDEVSKADDKVVIEFDWNEDSWTMKNGVNYVVVESVQGVSQFNHPGDISISGYSLKYLNEDTNKQGVVNMDHVLNDTFMGLVAACSGVDLYTPTQFPCVKDSQTPTQFEPLYSKCNDRSSFMKSLLIIGSISIHLQKLKCEQIILRTM
ncbi:hypothetical protein Tco_0417354 [Tanacetum coccineum]